MKWLVALFLLANVTYWGWNIATSSRYEPSPSPINSGDISELKLIAEVEADVVPGKSPALTGQSGQTTAENLTQDLVAETALPGPACSRIAGLPDLDGRRVVSQRLQRLGFEILAEGAERGEKTRYWVFLQPLVSSEAVTATVRRIRESGMSDYYVIPDGENTNAISLGVFSSLEGARARFDAASRAGLRPKIDEITLPVRTFWLDFRSPDEAGSGDSPIFEGIPRPHPISCP